jgi:hypothetical protein
MGDKVDGIGVWKEIVEEKERGREDREKREKEREKRKREDVR